MKNIYNINNEIEIKINQTISKNIINAIYYDYISEVVVNGESGNIQNYRDLLTGVINTIIIKFNDFLIDCSNMFYGLGNILYINTLNFNSSSVTNMRNMFGDCYSLISLDLSYFNTSSVTDMGYLFYNCYSLKSLSLNNFDTSSVTYMDYMFYYCRSLESLYIDNFDVSSAKNLNYMFYSCQSLISLNLSNFNFNADNYTEMFKGCNPNLEYCIDDKKYYKFLELVSDYKNNCTDICINWNSKKYIKEENLCVDKGPSQYGYKYNQLRSNQEQANTTTSQSEKKNLIGIITVIVAGFDGLGIIAIIIIIIAKRRAKLVNVTFIEKSSSEDENNFTIKTKIFKEKTIEDLIDLYYKKKGIPNNNLKLFLYKGDIINSEDIKSQKVVDIIGKNYSKENNPDNSMNGLDIDFDKNYTETGKPFEIEDDKNNNENIKNGFAPIFVIEKEKIIIIFNELKNEKNNGQTTEICISSEKTVQDLITLYYKKRGFQNQNQKIFLYNEMNISKEENKNKKIKSYAKNKYIMKISVLEKGNKEIKAVNFIENGNQSLEVYLSIEKKMVDLINIYCKNREVERNNKKIFLYNNEDISSKKNKNKMIKNYLELGNNQNMDILVFERGSKEIKEINFIENGYSLFVVYLPSVKKVNDLINIYNEKSGNKESKSFSCAGEIITFQKNKKIEDIQNNFHLEVLVIGSKKK